MGNRGFLILHRGADRRSADHWQYCLAQRLRRRGGAGVVRAAVRPRPAELQAWNRVIEDEPPMARGDRVAVCHSPACTAWLHLSAARGAARGSTGFCWSPRPGRRQLLGRPAPCFRLSPRAWRDCVFSPPYLSGLVRRGLPSSRWGR
ncbi:alpha/beta hydrolase [Streptomonospora arabica]|uniref:Alpha/beta hydrolase n=1 Tax=Streptomonospora arabica TaxID=412417 RepID=A0ABV9SPQ4_9ACTN